MTGKSISQPDHCRQGSPQDWEKADVRILGQILAAQNVVFTLPDTTHIAEFIAQVLLTIPGIFACRVCLGGKSALAGEMAGGDCAQCETQHHPPWETEELMPIDSTLTCSMAGQSGMQVIAIDADQHRFGFFVLKIDQPALNALYQPFVRNLAVYVALILENRWQKNLLQKAHDDLERKVEERTHELSAVNEALAVSRSAALEMAQTAVEARQRAEHASAELERKVAEHKKVELEYRTLVETVPDFIARYDLDLRRIYVNPAWERASGLSSGEVVGVAHTEIPKVPNPVVDEYAHALRRVMKTGDPQSAEFTWENAFGETLDLEYRIVPEYDHLGIIAGVLAVGRDITERKQSEAKLAIYREHLEELVQERTAQLEAANQELEAFAYSVSHDLRAPLRHIDGFVGLLQQTAGTVLDKQSRHYMGAIAASAQKMGQLIDDLLNFSRTGRQALSFRHVALGSLVRDVIRELDPDTIARTIEWRIEDLLPTVFGDEPMLRIVLVNLISNALKFTRMRPQPRIEIGSLTGLSAETEIFVRDNGVGFDMAYVDDLFGVFQRLHPADEFEGTGIGLATVRRIIARHGGRTWAQGELDRGATFFFALPCSSQGDGNEKP